MVSIEEIKKMIIKNETEWIEEIHDDDAIPGLVNGMIDEVNSCKDIDDIADFYTSRGYDLIEAYESIILVLRENTQVKE